MRPTSPADGPGATDRRTGEAKETRQASIGPSVFVKGEVAGSEDLTVDGRVEGRIDLPDHVLTVGPNAKIQASVDAKVVRVFGSVVGSITARDKVEVRVGGSVEGDVKCARIVIQDGAHLCGKVDMQRQRSSAGSGSQTLVA